MKRTFKLLTITAGGTPQPLIGTTLTAASVISDEFNLQQLTVADSSIFNTGDWAVIDVGAVAERHKVQQIPDATHIKVAGLRFAHSNGALVRLSMLCQSIYVQTKKVNGGSIYLGNSSSMVKATYVGVIAELLPVAASVQPVDWSDPILVGQDGSNCGDFWVDGTTADGYLPSLSIL